MTKEEKAKIDHYKFMLLNDDRWTVRGLLAIYKFQTEDEKNSNTTKHENGVGFSGTDAEILSSFAQQAQKRISNCNMERFKLTDLFSHKQIEILRKKLPKYAGQLVRMSK